MNDAIDIEKAMQELVNALRERAEKINATDAYIVGYLQSYMTIVMTAWVPAVDRAKLVETLYGGASNVRKLDEISNDQA